MKLVTLSLKVGMATLALIACVGFPFYSQKNANAADETPAAHTVTIKGYIRDAECPLRYKGSMKPQGSCAMDCVKKGSPIVLLTKNGELYIPVDPTPEKDVRPLLMPHFGKYVSVTGDLMERGRLRAITVEEMREVPDNQ